MGTTTTSHWVRWKANFFGLAILMGISTGGLAHSAGTQSFAGQPSKACQAQATRLSKWLTAYAVGLDRQPTFIILPDEVELVSIDRSSTTVDSAMVVLLSPGGTTVDGETVSGDRMVLIDRIRTALARQQSLASLTGQPVTQSLVLAVDRRVIWQRVVDTVDAAKVAGAVNVALAFRSTKTPKVPAPGPSPFDQRLMTIRKAKDLSARTEGLAALSSSLVAACPPLQAPFTTMARRGGLVPVDFANALRTCHCAADAASIQTLIWSIHPPLPGTLLTLTLTADTSHGTVIAAKASLPWAAAHSIVLKAVAREARTPVQLEVRPAN